MTLLRAYLMQVRARHGDWDSAPVLACNPEDLSASRTGTPFSTGHPLNLHEPLLRKALDFSNPATYIPA